ncbi:MAG: hypothetical protein ABH851_09400 [Methanobacteriota archaeon]
MKKTFLVLFVGTFFGIVVGGVLPQYQSFEVRREKIISNMESTIAEKSEAGEYRCCITPACDMCFLGHWLWDDGICRCDEMIAKGEFDKVCPQCQKAIEEGACNSEQQSDTCPVPGL